MNDESKRIVKTATKLIREAVRNFDHSTSTYSSTDNKNHIDNHM